LQGSKIQLDILVENMGRVNFFTFMNKQRKGKSVYFALIGSGNPCWGQKKVLKVLTMPVYFCLYISTGNGVQGTIQAYI